MLFLKLFVGYTGFITETHAFYVEQKLVVQGCQCFQALI